MKYIVIALVWLLSIIVAIFIGKHSYANTIISLQKKCDSFKSYYFVLTYWLEIRQKGGTIEKYFADRDYKNIIVYGYGPIGRRVIDELRNSDVNVCLVVDSNLEKEDSILGQIDDLSNTPADMVLVTPTMAYKEIRNNIKDKVSCPISSLDEVVFSL